MELYKSLGDSRKLYDMELSKLDNHYIIRDASKFFDEKFVGVFIR